MHWITLQCIASLHCLLPRMCIACVVVLCCVVLRCVALRCVVLQCCVVLCCVVLCCVVLCCVVLCCVALYVYCIALHLYCIVLNLYCIVLNLYCIALYWMYIEFILNLYWICIALHCIAFKNYIALFNHIAFKNSSKIINFVLTFILCLIFCSTSHFKECLINVGFFATSSLNVSNLACVSWYGETKPCSDARAKVSFSAWKCQVKVDLIVSNY